MKYLNARNTAFGEDRRSYKTGTNGVTSNQTVFNVSYDNGRVEAYLNGVRLYPGDDFTKASSGIGTTITLASAIGANNVLEIVGYQGINSGNALVEDNFVVGTNSTGSGGSYGGSTTVFNVASSAGDTVSVWRNGVKLVPTTDYTVQASASTVTLASPGASSADEITVQVVGALVHADFIRGIDLQDDDAFGSVSATKVASSESIKAYADTKLATSTASSTYQTITNSDKLAYQSVPHIIPDVLYPAVEGKDLAGVAFSGSYVYGTAHTDNRKYYYTDIKGSKPIKDPRIGGHFGSQRHKFKSIQLLEQETATHGKSVYSVDGREWVRAVQENTLAINNNTHGNNIALKDEDYVEIVGYFNNANFSTYTFSGNTFEYKIDGGSFTNGDYGSASVSTPLGSRYVDASSFINLGISASLGIHTLRIKYDAGGTSKIYAVELIAQDTTSTANRSKIQIPSQNVVSYGKKFTVSGTPHYDPFNGFTSGSSVSSYIDTATSLGVENWKNSSTYYRPYNGGRVVKWVDSSGVIKTSVTLMPPNAQNVAGSSLSAKANASVANDTYLPTFSGAIDHSLAEVAKTFNWREFGNGGANGNASYKDASMLNSDDNIAYVMDDGLTSLSAYDVSKSGSSECMKFSNTNRYSYHTFIGTGVSFRSIESTDAKVHVAQNLPYGSHVLKIVRGGTHTLTIDGVDVQTGTFYSFAEIDIYQPKKPPIPEDACVLADFMLMADYVKSTNTTEKIDDLSKGIRLQAASRDIFYDRTGGSWDALGHGSYVTNFITPPVVAGGNSTSLTAKLPYFGFTKGALSARRSTDATDLAVTATNTSGSLESTNVAVSTRVVPALSANIADLSHSGNVYGFFNWEKSDGVLGSNTVSFDDVNLTGTFDWMYISAMEIATPIHTSSHYQSFETPYLHELVGGDRNMEQTNLVVSPDGKSWDEVTRDTSYIGSPCVNANTDQGGVIIDEWRGAGGSADPTNYFNKDWAIAYDRIICLKSGMYEVSVGTLVSNGHLKVWFNSTSANQIIQGHDNTGNSSVYGSAIHHFQRGDYIAFQSMNSSTNYNTVTINRL